MKNDDDFEYESREFTKMDLEQKFKTDYFQYQVFMVIHKVFKQVKKCTENTMKSLKLLSFQHCKIIILV